MTIPKQGFYNINEMKSREKSQIIRNYLILNNLSQVEFCKKLNVPYKSLRKVLTGQSDSKFNKIFKLAQIVARTKK